MDLHLYSKYRTPLMGIAMLMVIAYHQIGKPAEISLFNYDFFSLFCSLCHGGTDIFIFFSGMGLYYSLSKGDTIKVFYKRRVIRLIPCYYIVILLVAWFSNNISFWGIVEQMSIIGFFIPGLSYYDWFVPSILFLYLITPWYHKYFYNKECIATALAVLTGLVLTTILIVIQKGTIIQFFSRIPIFFIGFYIGYSLKENKKITKSRSFIILLILLAMFSLVILAYLTLENNNDCIFLRRNGITHLPWILITPGFCFCCAYLLSVLEKFKTTNWINVILVFIGGVSLEVYLIHMGIPRTNMILGNHMEVNIINIALAFSLSKLVSYIVDNFILKKQ